MSKQQAAAAIIAFIVLDEDESKKRGKTRNWIKRRPLKGCVCEYCPRTSSGGHTRIQGNDENEL